jgi:rhodanese-related sulfurtransferase
VRIRLYLSMIVGVLVTCVGSISAQRPEVIGPASVPRLSLSDFRGRLPSGTLLVVDVRDELVYRAGHIPGAISVPLAEIEKHALDLRGRAQQRLVVTYCSCPSEQTALTAAVALWKSGLTNVSVLIGGYPEWVATGGAIEKGGGG